MQINYIFTNELYTKKCRSTYILPLYLLPYRYRYLEHRSFGYLYSTVQKVILCNIKNICHTSNYSVRTNVQCIEYVILMSRDAMFAIR